MKTEVIRGLERFSQLAGQWDSLTAGPWPLSPALSHGWFSAWLEAFGRDARLSVVALFEGEELVAAAPVCVVRATHRGIPCVQLRFLYNRHAPRCAFLVKEGGLELGKRLMRETLGLPDWDLVVLENVPHGSVLFDLAGSVARSAGFRFLSRETMSSPLLRIAGPWGEFFESRPRNLRRSLHNKENRISAAGKLDVEHITDAAAAEAVMDTLFGIGAASWKASRGRAIGSDSGSRTFYSLLARHFGRRGELSVWLARLNEEPVAFEFHLTRGKLAQALRAEFDEKHRGLGVGSVLDKEIISRLFDLGFEEYDMGGEADFYKLRWTSEATRHSELLFFRDSWKGRFLHRLESRIVEPSKRLLKRRRGSPES